MQYDIGRDGFAIYRAIFSAAELEELSFCIGSVSGAGRRGMLAVPAVAELSRSTRVLDIVQRHLPIEPVAVRAIYFNKTSETNWLVPWHQDLTLALRASSEVAGFGPWSVKEGIPHVQPPVACLEQMVAVRVHLDQTDESNGALRVLPGSHQCGRLSAQQIEELRTRISEVVCSASIGDLLVMRPLLLHASSRSLSSRPRRVLHIEYAGFLLPNGLHWHEFGEG